MGDKGLVYCVKPGRSIFDAIPVPKAKHREMLRDREKRVDQAENAAKVWDVMVREWWGGLTSWDRRRRKVSGQILAILLVIERRRLALGWSGDVLLEKAGIDGERTTSRAYLKWRRPWANAGSRTPSEETLLALINAVSGAAAGDGWVFQMPTEMEWLSVEEYERKLVSLEVRHCRPKTGEKRAPWRSPKVARRMGEMGARGGMAGRGPKKQASGRRGGKARAEKLSPEERSEIAQKGGHARWARRRSGTG